ncbi:NEO1-like protein [Mya arenaria]|uniref:NEO1-like protein n=1 Tax=Mya arenaria TaxID=6604 RepID=A0ABY7G7R5_MYAAR|nr:NEO1-like protein [Mya arenaria]
MPCSVVHANRGAPIIDWYKNGAKLDISLDRSVQVAGMERNFYIEPEDVEVYLSDTAMFQCAIDSIPAANISWFKDNQPVSDRPGKFRSYPEGVLEIYNVEFGDLGSYLCSAEGVERSRRSPEVKLSQKRAVISDEFEGNIPDFTLKPRDTSTLVGSKKQGRAGYDDRWREPADFGLPPVFTTQPQNLFANEKRDIIVPCQASGHPKPKITWYKNGEIIAGEAGDYVRVIEDENLQFLGLVMSDSGYYQCFAENSVGTIQATMQLKVVQQNSPLPISPSTPSIYYHVQRSGAYSATNPDDVPSQPTSLMVAIVSTRYVTLTWSEPDRIGPSEIIAYMIKWVETGSERERVTNTTQREVNILHLRPNSEYQFWVSAFNRYGGTIVPANIKIRTQEEEEYTEYTFRVVANNTNGVGLASPEVTARTFSDMPSDMPQNFTLETASSTSLVVRWQPPLLQHCNGKITGYKIRYKKKGAKQGATVTTAGDRVLYALTDLRKDTQYQVRISAQTVNGSGPPTNWLNGKTYADDLDESHVPEMPDRLVVRPGTNSLIVQWVPNRRSQYLVRGYYLGYGKGIPDVYRQLFDATTFFYTIENLQPASEYVVSIRGFNQAGEGPPRYETVFTLEETAEEPITPMLPPIGLKALVLSSQTIVLTWTDNSLGKIQRITDNRYYTISTELVHHIEGLKPNAMYEFSVKVTKGRRKSSWSMAVANKTQEAAPSSIPRDLTAVPVEGDPLAVTLNWQPPQRPNGQITGYLVFYTTDNTKEDLDWVVEGVQARNSKGYGPMSPTKIYKTPKVSVYGGVRPNSGVGGKVYNGVDGKNYVNEGEDPKEGTTEEKKGGLGGLSQNVMIIIIACVVGATFCIVVAVITVFLCRRRDHAERNRMARIYKDPVQKAKSPKPSAPPREGQPPDLWIDHDHLELKSIGKDDRGESSVSIASTRRNSLSSVHTNIPADIYNLSGSEAEERLLPPSYNQLTNSQQRNIIRPKPLKLPVDAQTHREPVAMVAGYPNSNIMTRYTPAPPRPGSPGEDSGVIPMRPVYPRTQYQMQYAAQGPPRVNAGDISNTASSGHAGYPMEYGYRLVPCMEGDDHGHPEAYDESQMHRVGYGGFTTPSHHGSLNRRHKARTPITGIASPVKHMSSNDISITESTCMTPGIVHSNSGTFAFGRTRSPLRSFSVPDSPTGKSSTPKHIVKPQQTATPFKKVHTAPPISSGPIKPRAMMAPMVSPKSAPDVLKTEAEEDIQKSVSTEELTAEMANLEGLMKDLNAITQQDFEC